MRIIPAIDIINGECVRLSKGDYNQKTIYSKNVQDVAKNFEANGIQFLHLVDLDGAKQNQIINYKILEKISAGTNLIIDFGGGLKSEKDIEIAFESGANQVTLGSVAVKNPELFQSSFEKYGSEKIRFVDAIYDKTILDTLRHYAHLYFHGHSVGGTNPSLLEAMACSCTIVAHDNQFNKGVLENEALYFKDAASLAGIINTATGSQLWANNTLDKIENFYSEDYVFSQLKDKLYEWHTFRNKKVKALI